MNPSEEFAQELTQLETFRVWFAALPEWARDYPRGVLLTLALEKEGVGANLQIATAPEEGEGEQSVMYRALLDRLAKTERLAYLGRLVDDLKRMGLAEDFINPFVEEANLLATGLYPHGHRLDAQQSEALAARLEGH